jgi:hypothetical protein
MTAYTKPEIIILDAEKMIPQARITNYESFSWTHNWYGIDEFTIKVNRYKNGVDQFRDESYIAFKDSEGTWKVGILGKVTKPKGADGKSSEQFTINGIGIEGIFNNRICVKDFANSTTEGYTVLQSMSIETAMRQIVNDECIAATDTNNDLPGLSLNVVDYERPASNVVLDLRFSGTNGSTTFKDSSKFNKAITAYGEAQISTAQYKFNSSSLYIGGVSGSRLTLADSDHWDFGSGSFSVSGWVYLTDISGFREVINRDSSTGYPPWHVSFTSGSLRVLLSQTGSSWEVIIVGSTVISANTWNYFTLIRDTSLSSNQVKAYLNGSLEGQASLTGALVSSSDPLCVGNFGLSYPLMGYLADIVVKKGEIIDGTIVPVTQFSDPNVAEKSIRADTVASVLESLGRQSGVSSRLTWGGATVTGPTSDRRLFQFDVLEGNDLSTGENAVKLSVEFGNLLTYEYVYSVLNSKNFLYVGGSGDGADRLLTTAYSGDTIPTGWDRRAAFFDSTESTTAAQAQAAGAAQLLTLGPEQTLTFDYNYMSNSYKFGTHFKNGDIVVAKVADVAEITARITQVTETYDANGKKLSLGMGTSSIDLVSILKAQIKATRKLQAH